MNSIYHRISVRKYENHPVEKEKITEILKAGMQALSAGNQQPWEFYVMTEPVGYPAEFRPQQNRFDESRIHVIG